MPRPYHAPQFRLSLMQILVCVTAVGCGYAMMQSTTLLIMLFVMSAVLIGLVILTAMIVLLLTIIEVLLHASEYITRAQFAWQDKRV